MSRVTHRNRRAALAIAATLIAAAPAVAGVVDAPIPPLNGKPAAAVFYVPGVQATPLDQLYAHGGNMDTVFTCTSMDTQDLTFQVDLFDYTGAGPLDLYGQLPTTLKPGETRTICTEPIDGIGIWHSISPKIFIYGGSARIISTSPKIACDAAIGRTVQDVDTWSPLGPIANLRVIRNDQKGD